MQLSTSALTLAVLLATTQTVRAVTTCSVLDYGGVADNSTDLGPALTSAWNDCVIPAATSTNTDTLLYVPSGDYLLSSNVVFDDAANFNLHIAGSIFLPFDESLTGTMLTFELTLYPSRPRLIRFQDCNNCEITQVYLYDAPMFHVTIIGDNNEAHDMAIIASHIGETDGFDMSGNNNYVHDVTVENGDECVTVKTPTNGFVAERITCRWTAGCNVGSFGDDNTDVDVQNVVYRDVTLSNSDAGVMIKSYPNNAGTVKNLTYTGFTLDTVAYPIDIDIFWMGDGEDTGTLSVTDVTFDDFSGSGTSTRPALKLNCNSATPCEGIAFSDISITGAAANQFTNACGSGVDGLDAC